MKYSTYIFILLTALTLYIIGGCQSSENISPTDANNDYTSVEGQYIIVFNDEKLGDEIQSVGGMQQIVEDFLRTYNIEESALQCVYSYILRGFCTKLTIEQLEAIKADKRIAYIEQDKVITLEPVKFIPVDVNHFNDKTYTIQTQTTPWGINAVGGASSYSCNNQAWIIDTGVDLDHSDLNVNTTLSKSFISRGSERNNPDDLNGHGTHVAGTIAAKNNDIGVVGVAAGARVVAIKVLDRNGSGTVSNIVSGLDYVYQKAADGDVVNCSFGGSASTTLDNAVKNFDGSGVYVSIAAGNSAKNAGNYSPARVNGTGIYTVSAHDVYDNFASFSNYGNPPIDWCAPGVSVLSTYKNNGYATSSGTSMSAPHVAGILLASGGSIQSRGYVSNDKDNNPDKLAEKP